jgi:hypothetical protein
MAQTANGSPGTSAALRGADTATSGRVTSRSSSAAERRDTGAWAFQMVGKSWGRGPGALSRRKQVGVHAAGLHRPPQDAVSCARQGAGEVGGSRAGTLELRFRDPDLTFVKRPAVDACSNNGNVRRKRLSRRSSKSGSRCRQTDQPGRSFRARIRPTLTCKS